MPEMIEVASRSTRLNRGNCFSKRSIGAAINSPAVTLPSPLKIGAATPAAPGTVSPMLTAKPSRRIVCNRCRSLPTSVIVRGRQRVERHRPEISVDKGRV